MDIMAGILWKSGSKGKISLKSDQEVITDVLMSDVQDCGTYLQAVQVQAQIGVGNVMRGGQQTAAVQINANCYASSEKMVDLQNEIILALTQKADVVASGFSLDRSKSKIENDIRTSVRNNIKQEFIQSCITSANTYQQQLQIGGYNIAENLQQDANLTVIRDCVGNSQQVSNIANAVDLNYDIEQTVETRNFLADTIGAFGEILQGFWIIILVGFIVLVLGFSWLFSGEEGTKKMQIMADTAKEMKPV